MECEGEPGRDHGDHRQLRDQPRAADDRPFAASAARYHRRRGRLSVLRTFDDYLSALDRDPPALNAACQVGHSTLRVGSMRPARPAGRTPPRSTHMGERCRNFARRAAPSACRPDSSIRRPSMRRPPRSMRWPPCASGGRHPHHSHARRSLASARQPRVNETFADRQAPPGVPVVISHHKTSGTPNLGRAQDPAQLIEAASDDAKGRARRLSLCRRLHGVGAPPHSERARRSLSPGRRAHPELAGRRRWTPIAANWAAT